MSELDFEESAEKSSDESFNEPGWVTKIEIDENSEVGEFLIIYFQKGLKRKVQQDPGSRERYYYGKWNFFVDEEYLTTFTNTDQCGDTKQSNCAIGASIDEIAKLKIVEVKLSLFRSQLSRKIYSLAKQKALTF